MARKSSTKQAGPPVPPSTSRAVLRVIEAGTLERCPQCRDMVRFVAKKKLRQVIANVYVDGKWHHKEHYHDGCYIDAGEPYGSAGKLPRVAY